MKVLYVTNHMKIASASKGYISDYMNDLLFFGLYEILGTDVIDSTPIISLYKQYEKDIDKSYLWGGFTAFWLIDNDIVNRTDIEDKIKYNYYDLIIYGSIKRCNDYYDIVSKAYSRNKVILIDGNDEQSILPLSNKHLYFKREFAKNHKNVLPISFAIPTPKITKNKNKNKTKGFANIIPGSEPTYIFSKEEEYYKDYSDSFYGMTKKKDGWDCMRHYEILGNYCIPYFTNIEKCPKLTMANFPKKLIIEGMKLLNESYIESDNYYSLLDQLFEFTNSNLSTKSMAQRVLELVL